VTNPATCEVVLCNVDDIAHDSSKGFEINGALLFAVRKDGIIYVYRNRCPHLGINLEWNEDQFLDSDGALIQCATHGALFIIESGECVAGPCRGEALTPVNHVIVGNEVLIELPVEP
jgi:nitrite reductase/ring-hydroxylating ferredoxin subunit